MEAIDNGDNNVARLLTNLKWLRRIFFCDNTFNFYDTWYCIHDKTSLCIQHHGRLFDDRCRPSRLNEVLGSDADEELSWNA